MVALPSSAWFMGRIMDGLNVFHIKTGNFMGVQNGIEVTPPLGSCRQKYTPKAIRWKKKKHVFVSRDRPLQTTCFFLARIELVHQIWSCSSKHPYGGSRFQSFGPTHLSVDWCKGNFTGIFRGTSVKSDDLWCSHFHTTWTMVSK